MSLNIPKGSLTTVSFLARKVQESERVPSPLEEARSELYDAMRQAREQGFTLQQIGEAAGLSRQRVFSILARRASSNS